MHVAGRLIHLIGAEVGVVAADCSGVVLRGERRRGGRGAAIAPHELRREVSRTVEKEQRQGVGAQSGLVDRFASISYVASLPVDEQVSRITANVLKRFLE